jgi:hypothetical protein
VFDTGSVTVAPATLRELAEQARPVALAREQVIPVLPALRTLVPGGALRRGSVVAVGGEAGTSLALALAVGPSAAGSWVAAVGLPALGLDAAAELGLALERLVLVPRVPAGTWGAVMASLVGAGDVVLFAPDRRIHGADARRLVARARERGSVLVMVDSTGASSGSIRSTQAFEPDLRLSAGSVSWHGLGRGHGRLQARQVVVEATGRREAARPRRAQLWLPDEKGEVVEDHDGLAPVTQLAHRANG